MPRIEANGIKLYYEARGSGAPLTLIEGIGYSTWMWFRQVGPLSAFHRLLLFDNRGVGHSDKPEVDYTVRDVAEDLAGLLDALGIASTDLLGVSAGGFIAQEFTLAYPERVGRLILAGTAPFGDPQRVIPEETLRLMVPDPSLAPEQRIRKAMAPGYAPGYAEAHPEVVDAIVAMRLAAPPQPIEAYVRQAKAFAAFDATERLAAIEVPVLILHGDQDRVVRVECSTLLAQAISGSQLLLLAGGGHLVFVEQADPFNEAVLEFLQ